MNVTMTAARLLSADDLRALTPHRHPFALLDAVTELVPGRSASGIKNVTVAEPWFAGHFPDHYVFPGVLLVEVLAQLSGVVYGSARRSLGRTDGPMIGYLAAVRSFKFIRPVRPGDRVCLQAELGATVGTLTDFTVSASVDGQQVAAGRLALAEMTEEGEER